MVVVVVRVVYCLPSKVIISGQKTIVVGNGGVGGMGMQWCSELGTNGKDTTFTNLTTAIGGGGAGGDSAGTHSTGNNGASGGGSGYHGTGGSGLSGQGYGGGASNGDGASGGGGAEMELGRVIPVIVVVTVALVILVTFRIDIR